MLSAKDAQTLSRAARNRGTLATFRARRRRVSGGQSVLVAIIVLFLLLFLGGVFIALIANNLRNTKRGTQISAADKFAEGGIKYLDQQLTNAPEGADWRPVPDCPAETAVCANVQQGDPDYFWLKPYDPATGEGGYTRVTFGGTTPGQANIGGRALVRVSYRPYRQDPATGDFWDDLNGNGVYDPATEKVDPATADRTRRYIRLESVGRVGTIDPLDPTTFVATQGLGLRRELVAYKALGLTENLRFETDKDKRRTPAALGAPFPVTDRDQSRYIYSVYQGGIRSNTDLTFYGMNYLALDSRRGDDLEVSGSINVSGLSGTNTTPTANDSSKVFLADVGTAAATVSVASLGGTAQAGNVLPSTAASFTTLNGLVRDNPRGNETQDLPADLSNNNFRAAPRIDPPIIDGQTGDNGLTRYRALTRDALPMSTADTGNDPPTTPPALPATNVAVGIGNSAGAFGWGQNLYIANAVDLPIFSDAAANATSQRAEWLNPSAGVAGSPWVTDSIYTPPAVTITLTPRWFSMTQSANANGRNRSYLRRPDNGQSIGDTGTPTLYRYTYDKTVLNTAPTKGIDEGGTAAYKFAGYPAALNPLTNCYEGDFVIFCEGNVRLKGSVGGYDPETGKTFVRHITVVTNGTVYVDGNLLRDNISPEIATAHNEAKAAKGKSSVALLAKNYIAVNTTQFLSPSVPANVVTDTSDGALILNDQQDQLFALTLGPANVYDNTTGLPVIGNVFNATNAALDINQTPPYLASGASPGLLLLMRHAPNSNDNSPTSIDLFINNQPSPGNEFNWGATYPLTLTASVYQDMRFILNPPGASYLFPVNGAPYTGPGSGTAANLPAVGISNRLQLHHDPSSGKSPAAYKLSRFGIVPLDIRIEALMYAQEGSFFIIPGASFNPNANDTYAHYVSKDGVGNPINHRAEDQNAPPQIVSSLFPFYGEPLDVRITMFGAITENLPAEIGDQGAWLQKWGWVPRYYGSTGLPSNPQYPQAGATVNTFHGAANAAGGVNDGVGNGITYIYDPRLSSPYDASGAPLRLNPNYAAAVAGTGTRKLNASQAEPLPPMPRLPVAPGLLFRGERPVQ